MLAGLSDVKDIYIACGSVDMRKSINGLSAIVSQKFRLDPCSGALFLFCGKDKRKMKALLWDGNGFILLYKRWENGKLQWPKNGDDVRKLTDQQLRWLLEGLSIDQPKAIGKASPGYVV